MLTLRRRKRIKKLKKRTNKLKQKYRKLWINSVISMKMTEENKAKSLVFRIFAEKVSEVMTQFPF